MKVHLIFGFLGSGKTTLIRQFLTAQPDLSRTAVIVNEFGDVGIDGAIMEGNNISIIELNSGCLCCNLKGPMLDAIDEIESSKQVDTLVIESSGLAEPIDTLEALTDPKLQSRIEIGPIVTVVSLPHFEKLCEFLGDFYTEQIRNADTIILNKVDLIDAEESRKLRDLVRLQNNEADLLIAHNCDVDLYTLFSMNHRKINDFVTQVEGLKRSSPTHAEHAHEHMDSIVVENSKKIMRKDLEHWLSSLPNDLYRIKGFLNLDGQHTLLQYSMGQCDLTPNKNANNYQIVFIGKHLDRTTITRSYELLGANSN